LSQAQWFIATCKKHT